MHRMGDRLGYRLDRFLGLHPLVQLATFVALLFALAFGVGIVLFALDAGSPSVTEGFWWSITRMLDGGTVASDSSPLRRVLGLGTTLFGLAALAVLTGAFASVFSERLKQLRDGTLPVYERRHVLLLGYNAHAGVILRELATTDLRVRVVVLADQPRDVLEDQVRAELAGISHRLRIVVRRGDPAATVAIARAAARRARAIVVLPESPSDDDHQAGRSGLRSLLAARRALHGRAVPILLDASTSSQSAVDACAEPGSVVIVDAAEVNARVLAQSVQEPGAFDVVRQILSLDDRSVFLHPAGRFAGKTFEQAHAAIEKGILIGLARDGTHLLSPEGDLELAATDELIVFSDAMTPLELAGRLPKGEAAAILASNAQGPLDLLVVRFKPDLVRMIAFLDAVRRVRLTLLVPPTHVDAARAALDRARLRATEVAVEVGDPLDPSAIERVLARSYDAVVLVAPDVSPADVAEADADQLLTLLYVRRFRRGARHVIVEVRSADTVRLAPPCEDTSEDFVISRELVGMLLAQEIHAVALRRGAIRTYYEIFTTVAARIRLRPIAPYAAKHELPSFALLMANARARGEIAIGVAEVGHRADLLPRRDERFCATDGARLVILTPAMPATVPTPSAIATADVPAFTG
jgi:Trk K+ transport system NAD-binding subunit